MKKHQKTLIRVALGLFVLSFIGGGQLNAASLDDVLGVRSSTTVDGAKSQAKIDGVTEQTRDLLQQYKTVMKVVDGLKVYNAQQRRLIQNQKDELAELAKSITLIHRRDEFRGAPNTEAQMRELIKIGKVKLKTPYVIDDLLGTSKISGAAIKNFETKEYVKNQ